MSRRSGESFQVAEFSEPLTVFDYAVEWVLALAMLFSPLALGGVESWAQQILFVLVAVVVVLVGAKLTFVRGSQFVFTWAYLPIVLYILLVTLSVIPLPAGLVQAISPGTVETKSALLSDLPNAHEILSRVTISFNVWSTEHGLRTLLAMGVVFTVIVNTYRTPGQIKRLLGTVACVGAVVSLLALAQDITHVDGKPYQIYWTIDVINAATGPYAGHAQLGQFLNLTIGAMLALAVVLIAETFHGEDPSGREIVERLNTNSIRLAILLGALMCMAAAAIAWSQSHGAEIAMGIAGLVVIALLIAKRGWRPRETPILCILAILIAVAGIAVYELMATRLPRLNGTAAGNAIARFYILKQMPPMFKTWPVMGSGLQSFEWVFPMFEQNKTNHDFFLYAENDYAQTLTDTGIVGGLLVLSFLAIMFRNWIRSIFSRRPIQLAAVGIGFSILAVMIHSAADFSQHTPSIALVSTVMVGLMVSLGHMARPATEGMEKPNFNWTPWPRLVGALIVLMAMGWSIVSIDGIRRAEFLSLESDPTYFGLRTPQGDPDFARQMHAYFAEPIALDQKAMALDPDNVLYIYGLNHFRWRELAGIRDPKTTAVIFPPNAAEEGRTIIENVTAARVMCPTYGKIYTLIGAIQWNLLDKSAGLKNLELAHKLLPGSGEPLYYLAQAAAEQGDWDKAKEWAKECFTIDFFYKEKLVDLLVREHHRADVAYEVLKGSSLGMEVLANALAGDSSQKAIFDRTQARLLELARQATVDNPQGPNVWAAFANRLEASGLQTEAVDAYRTALNRDYDNVALHLTLARLLSNMGRTDEAVREAERCLSLKPEMVEAKVLLASLRGPKLHPDSP